MISKEAVQKYVVLICYFCTQFYSFACSGAGGEPEPEHVSSQCRRDQEEAGQDQGPSFLGRSQDQSLGILGKSQDQGLCVCEASVLYIVSRMLPAL